MINRDELLKEFSEEKRLRKAIRGLFEVYLKEKNKSKINETRLRKIVRKLITEANSTDVPSDQPHKSTGINVLEDLLRNIIPTIENDYKALTSDKEQRSSFRAHILNAIQNTLEPVDVKAKAGGSEELVEVEGDVTVNVTDENKFIPVRDIDEEPAAEENEEETFSAIEGMDETGRNFAANTFNKVEKQIIEAYESLANVDDRDLFYDYLLTNLKLYFDKFEDELKLTVDEPESPDYNPEGDAAALDAEFAGSEELVKGGGGS